MTRRARRLGGLAGALALVPGIALAGAPLPGPGSVQAGCHADRRACHVRVDPVSMPIAGGARLERFELRLNGATVYDFRTDVSNPPAGSYTATPPFPGFAARCRTTYVATLLAKDTADADLRPVGESAPFACPAPAACPPAPSPTCIAAERGRLAVNETRPGREKLEASLARFAADTAGGFGDPVDGETLYDVCVYDAEGALAGSLSVDRAGALCGAKQKPCWRAREDGRLAYKDPAGVADGVVKLSLKEAGAGGGKALVQASNHAKRGRTALPTGITAALAGTTSVTLQLHASGGACVSAELARVKKADGTRLRAATP